MNGAFIRGQLSDNSFVPAVDTASVTKTAWLPVTGLKFDVEQTLSIGSQSSGAGAGKIVFNPVSFTIVSGEADGKLLTMAASGTTFRTLEIKADNQDGTFQVFVLGLVAVKTVSWSVSSDGQLLLTVTLEYGSIVILTPSSATQDPLTPQAWTGTILGGWNSVKNIAVTSLAGVMTANA